MPDDTSYVYRLLLFNVIAGLYLFLSSFTCFSQTCSPDVFAITYEGNAAYSAFQTIETANKDLISVGHILQTSGNITDYDAWMYKLSPRGAILWARRYMLPGYNSGTFNAIAPSSDSTYMVSGRFSFLKRRSTDYQIEVLYTATVLLNVDKFGNLIWIKFFKPYNTYYTSIDGLTPLQDGSIMATASVYGNNLHRVLIFRMDTNAGIKWCTSLQADSVQTGSLIFKQLNNGSIWMAGSASTTNADYRLSKQGYYVMSLQAETGLTNWSKGYMINTLPAATGQVQQITEQGGTVSLFSSFSPTDNSVSPPYFRKGLLLQTGLDGHLKKAVGFDNGESGCVLMDAKPVGNDHLVLLHDGSTSLLARIDPDGQLQWQKGYGHVNGNISASSLYLTADHIRLYFSGKNQVAMSGLLQTEGNGEMACMETPSHIQRTEVSHYFTEWQHILQTGAASTDLFETSGGGINHTEFDLQTITSCMISCCAQTATSTTTINLCDQAQYQLPDGAIVTETGRYYHLYKKETGCDSIAYYDVHFNQTPRVSLGADTCLTNTDSIVLKIKDGFASYNWMNTITVDSFHTIYKSGTYWVEVANSCGSYKDSIQIFDNCDMTLYIPNAFTPNNDGRNDVFRYPVTATNKMHRLAIYNRWGQLLFQSRKRDMGWDGTVKGEKQPAGTYIYVFEIENLAGEKRTYSGTVQLIR